MIFNALFPSKCVLCHKLLEDNETDMCHSCRATAPIVRNSKRKVPNIAQTASVWYYKEDVRSSIHRFKFNNTRFYANIYARFLAMKLLETDFLDKIDVITWAPVSLKRRFKRGYDQGQLLATALGKELNLPVARLLRKKRHTAAQSELKDAAARRANVQGAYIPSDPKQTKNRTVLLIDDVLTTGSTASECSLVLHTAGAKEVYLATVALTEHEKSNKHR